MFYTVCKIIGILPLELLYFFRIRCIGKEKIPKKGALVVCCNHLSAMDPVFLMLKFRRHIRFIAKAEAFKTKIGGWFLRGMGAFPVHRGEADVDAVKTALRTLKEGGVLGVFPEGHRQKQGKPHDSPHSGAVMFAAKTKATVLPITITGEGGRVRFLHRVTLYIGDPVPFENLGLQANNKEEYARVTNELMETIYARKAALDAGKEP